MTEAGGTIHPRVVQFLKKEIESVPHLEALLLLRENPERAWSAEDAGRRLYVEIEHSRRVLDDLVQRGLVVAEAASGDSVYRYASQDADDGLMQLVAQEYRLRLVQVATLIHTKPSVAIHDFARAFRLKKE
jgi:hypothetical protein